LVGSIEVALTLPRLREHLQHIVGAAIRAVDPSKLLVTAHTNGAFEFVDSQAVDLIAAGKAAWPMAHTCAGLMPGRIRRGLIAGPRNDALAPRGDWQCIEAAHPLPDERSVEAGQAALELARGARGRPLVVLLSGGASSMLCAPVSGVPLADKAVAIRALMNAGAAIHELNCVRKHLSAVKGGRLGAAAGISLTLAISDVHHPVEDDPAVIGSGPTTADPSTFSQAVAIADRAAGIPASVRRHLRNGAAGGAEETIKPGDPRLSNARFAVIGNRGSALSAAAESAAALAYTVVVVPEPTHAEARVAAPAFLARALSRIEGTTGPVCVLAAGETTVHVAGRGRGGRNQEFALALVPSIADLARQNASDEARCIVLASVGTDGIDGPTPAAGAIVDWTTSDRARRAQLDFAKALENNDAYPFFEALDDLIVLGPTGTNVGDLQVMLVA
jgi:hydroxypyruvate reductase